MALQSDRDALGAYMGTLSTVEVLSREDARALALRYRAGDARAGAQLVRGCLPFVTSIALEYRKWGVPLEDIIQEGNVGLLKAAARFDPSRDCRLATYAGYWIRAEIREFVVRAFRVVRVGTTKGERRGLRARGRDDRFAGHVGVVDVDQGDLIIVGAGRAGGAGGDEQRCCARDRR